MQTVSSITGPAASRDPTAQESVTVAVVSICGAEHLGRCLQALATQEDAPPFDTLVVYDPNLTDVPALQQRWPHVRLVANAGQRTPLELAARAVQLAEGDIILLTEDHCIPKSDWVRRLYDATRTTDCAVVGGTVETMPGASGTDWAFYFVDFFRYMSPVREGPSPTLTVCNVAYRRARLAAIAPLWQEIFHETAINNALRERFGALWLVPNAEVRMRRNVRFGDAVYERYAFGRLFGCTRLQFAGVRQRLFYAAFAPALPVLLLGRMTAKAIRSPRAWLPFARALPALASMVFAWSWGEWLGYLTKRRPASLVVAPEIRARQRNRT